MSIISILIIVGSYQDKLDRYYSIKRNGYKANHPKSTREIDLSKELAMALGCKWEVEVPYGLGRADCLSKDILIECKKGGTTAEKAAIGQLLLYAYALKFKADLAIGIIGKDGLPKPGTLKFAKDFGIIVFYYNVYTCKWKLVPGTNQSGTNKFREFYL